MKYIKVSLRQQPIIFFNKSFKIKINNFFFDVTELHLKKKIIYLPTVIKYGNHFNYSFHLLIKKMWSFIKFIKLNKIYNSTFFNIIEKISLFLITFSVSNSSQQIMSKHSLKLNKIALKNKYKLFRLSKYKYVRRRRQKKKEIRIKGLYNANKKILKSKKTSILVKEHLSKIISKDLYKIIYKKKSLIPSESHTLLFHHKVIKLERRS